MSWWVEGVGLRAAMFALLLAAGTSLVVARVVPQMREDRESRERILAATGGGLSDEALAALAARMDPAAAARAQRRDAAFEPAEPTAWSWRAAHGWRFVQDSLARRMEAATPLHEDRVRAAPPFAFVGSDADRRRAVRCLGLAVYYEAAFEPPEGQAAVAQVVLNRVRDRDFPPTVCGVVFQGASIDYGCQFTFVCDGSMVYGEERWLWARAERTAQLALAGQLTSAVGTATYYHADYVSPGWSDLLQLGQVGRHIFYRGRGRAGEPGALSRVYRGGEPWINERRYARPRDPVPEGLDAAKAAEFERNTGPRGRRKPTRAEVDQINRTMEAYEEQNAPRPTKAQPGAEAPAS